MLNVNRSTYYKHLQENVKIRKQILELYARSGKRLGVRKTKFCLAREYCITIGEDGVYRLIKEMNLPKMSTVKLPKAVMADKKDVASCHNILAQKFNQKAPNLVWVADFTYVKVAGKFYYICAIVDLYAREVIACRVSAKIDRFLADILRAAVRPRGVSKSGLFHTDRGCQFTSADFRKVIDELGDGAVFLRKGASL